jgi:hypothetical protein
VGINTILSITKPSSTVMQSRFIQFQNISNLYV